MMSPMNGVQASFNCSSVSGGTGLVSVISPSQSSREFAAFARDVIVQGFGGRDPETAEYSMDVHD